MATSFETTLEEKVSELEAKSERIRSAKNVESKLTSASNSIERLNSELASLETTTDELSFFVDVLETVFDGDRPIGVERAISTAHGAASIDDEDVVEAAEKQDFAELFDAVEDARAEIDDAIDRAYDRITEEYQSPWEDELSSARELNRIIGGGDDEFLDVISSMKRFLEQAIWDPEKNPRTLATRWERLVERWEENSGKHGWGPFQDEHGLSNETIDELKQFTTKDTVRLSDLSLSTLEEIKQVEELESALQVELKS